MITMVDEIGLWSRAGHYFNNTTSGKMIRNSAIIGVIAGIALGYSCLNKDDKVSYQEPSKKVVQKQKNNYLEEKVEQLEEKIQGLRSALNNPSEGIYKQNNNCSPTKDTTFLCNTCNGIAHEDSEKVIYWTNQEKRILGLNEFPVNVDGLKGKKRKFNGIYGDDEILYFRIIDQNNCNRETFIPINKGIALRPIPQNYSDNVLVRLVAENKLEANKRWANIASAYSSDIEVLNGNNGNNSERYSNCKNENTNENIGNIHGPLIKGPLVYILGQKVSTGEKEVSTEEKDGKGDDGKGGDNVKSLENIINYNLEDCTEGEFYDVRVNTEKPIKNFYVEVYDNGKKIDELILKGRYYDPVNNESVVGGNIPNYEKIKKEE